MRVRRAAVAGAQGLALALMGLTGSVVLLSLTLVSLALIPIGLGVFTTPAVLRLVRTHALHRRALAERWQGIRIPVSYRPFPHDVRGGPTGQVERCTLMLKDPATWRDVRWLLVDATGAPVVAMLAPALVVEGVFGLLLAGGLWKPIVRAEGGAYWYTFVPVENGTGAGFAGLVGLALLAVALWWNPALIGAHFRLTAAVLRPDRETELVERIDRLTETRHTALDTSAAELRRIERDLHDGAQARLVAVGMSLGTVEALLEKDPAQARKLLAMARESSAEALTELRDLVRGIHPPVLAERGLGDAVRALALRLPVGCEVDVELPGRAAAPVESAAYFAVSEVLTNAVRHGGGDRIWVDVSYADGALRIAVTDNGRGGAVAGPAARADGSGTGLSGVERRLGTFDGVLAVSSPVGGPTMVTMEIPCALS
ncbi:sensor histidine kinase [Streptomyces clavuligerus]|uniref:histidine kinase n=5 Tax=Streptomyces clavuligerus TaxID=1901 RepID=E2Q0X6_STRCL|nr:histidine kinase [Streptomyces clavuligerus]AXU16658.1 sensor histidine kinase [Streptomyces clavuligerus]EFG06519.1 putative two-component system sensor kinase [Streptomyces clavuligerus]MBY6305190.1 sensor domain-containing protein [Streptomyces clavuligerus]QCS07901.1 sensor histidine kinase [Streptomyces clavuligerus]QPJ92762.1 sensor histidine kinase [Streptomyces clavuligerus]